MPPRPVLALLLALATLPPFVAQATGSVVGSYTMFARIERYHLELSATTPSGERSVSVRSITPHLSPEARTILLPAAGYAVGADQIDLTIAGLPELARLVCSLHTDARAAAARLRRDPFDPTRGSEQAFRVDCREPR